MADPKELAKALMDGGGAAFGIYPNAGKRKNNDRAGSAEMPVQLLRGMAAGTLGLPGDIETIGRMIVKAGATPGSYIDRNMGETSALPTSDFYKEYLPLGTDSAGGKAAASLGSMFGIPGMGATAKAPQIAKGLFNFYKPFKDAAGNGLSAINSAANEVTNASKTVKIYDPKPVKQRPFNDDYPQGATGQEGSRLTLDIEGNPLFAENIAGRRVVGGVDEGVRGVEAHRIPGSLGISVRQAARSGSDLLGDAGRYTSNGGTRNIFIDNSLDAADSSRVFSHELSHGIDDLVFNVTGAGGSKIPTDGIKKELGQVYSDLNSAMNVRPGKIGATPASQGYKANQTDAELMAEALRAYQYDPNYFKTVAPKTAERIRAYVNGNKNLNQTIQFNSIAGGGLLAAEGMKEPDLLANPVSGK